MRPNVNLWPAIVGLLTAVSFVPGAALAAEVAEAQHRDHPCR